MINEKWGTNVTVVSVIDSQLDNEEREGEEEQEGQDDE